MLAGWPKRRDMLARGILALALKAGGHDLADDGLPTPETIRLRDYHLVYPYALLTGAGQMPSTECYQALNCALLSWDAQSLLAQSAPKGFLKGLGRKADLNRAILTDRLKTHMIPVEALPQDNYNKIRDPDDRAERVRVDYQGFLRARAELMVDAIEAVGRGQDWQFEPEPIRDDKSDPDLSEAI